MVDPALVAHIALAIHQAHTVTFRTPVDAGEKLKVVVQHAPPVRNVSTRRVEHQPLYWRSNAGADSLRDLRHGPPRQGACPLPVLARRRGRLALLAGRPSPYCLTQLIGCLKGTGGASPRGFDF